MKLVLFLTFIIQFAAQAEEKSQLSPDKVDVDYYEFFIKEYKDEADKKRYRFNEYEDIISGLAAFTIGNIGWFAANSDSLKVAYSIVQTIGLINVGKGIYNLYRPNAEREYYNLIKNQKEHGDDQQNYLSEGIIKIIATEKRAQRLSLFYTSSLLSAQYAINVFLDDTPEDVENIFYFLGGVNLIIAGYSYLVVDKYEKYYFQNKDIKSYQLQPVVFRQNDQTYAGLVFNTTF